MVGPPVRSWLLGRYGSPIRIVMKSFSAQTQLRILRAGTGIPLLLQLNQFAPSRLEKIYAEGRVLGAGKWFVSLAM